MPKDAYITARVDGHIKAKAARILRRVGISTTDAVSMLLHQIVLRNGLPFEARIPNAESLTAMAEIDAGGGEISTSTTATTFDRITRKRA